MSTVIPSSGPALSYAYDADGNMLSGGGRSLRYDTAGMVTSVTQGANTVSYTYNAEHQRALQIAATGTDRYYSSDPGTHTELQSFSSGGSRWIDYLHGPSGLIGAVYKTIPAGGGAATTTTLYYALDHLGSIAATVVSNGTGRTLRSYDNWGKQRFPSGADDTANTLWSQNAEVRGFIGQEQVAQIGLVNLNARMYDPWLGRFLQVDPIIGSIYNLQGLNPYSYVMNNPLTDSDPFGLCGLFSCPGKAIGSFFSQAFAGPAGNVLKVVVIIAVVATFQLKVFPVLAADAGLVAAGTTFAELPVGLAALDVGLSGALGGALNTGTLRGALIGAATAEVFWGVSQGIQPALGLTVQPGATPTAYQFAGNATLQAAVGCASSAASGGRCGSGALSAGFGSLITSGTASALYGNNPFLNAAIVGLGGGTGAALTGGRFGDGFYLAASGYLFSSAIQAGANGGLAGLSDFAGKIWNLPNTTIGLIYGGIGMVAGQIAGTNPSINFDNNSIQFLRNPLNISAVTLGNTINYGPLDPNGPSP